ncbi:hypothetical protein SpAn4DRAFT_5198 [Sporomusa ovata]|uniref:Uncharacterized protein n=1 Tax=Sporomusa ovata TaxID=2378 RepID=A0A0U1L1I3_9FIRM|nr:hypothetical protein SpAn4DRAFT_5198 [Sporomusa ovata]
MELLTVFLLISKISWEYKFYGKQNLPYIDIFSPGLVVGAFGR